MKTLEFEQLRSSKGEKTAFISPKEQNARIDSSAEDRILEEEGRRNNRVKDSGNLLRDAETGPNSGAQPRYCLHRQQRSTNAKADSQAQAGEDTTRDLQYRENRDGITDFQMRMSRMPIIWICPTPGMKFQPQLRVALT